MPPPGKPSPPRDRPPPPFPGLPIRLPEVTAASLAQGDLVIIRSTSSEFQSLEGLVSQKSLEPKAHAGMAADATGTAAANRMKLRLVSMNVRRTPGARGLREMSIRREAAARLSNARELAAQEAAFGLGATALQRDAPAGGGFLAAVYFLQEMAAHREQQIIVAQLRIAAEGFDRG